ncbi:MAG: ARMT1-like domain-containing protein [Pseudomonadota bacterium]
MNQQDTESISLTQEELQKVYRPGQSPEMDAWFTAFLIENHLDYYTQPDQAATPEQVRFMVYTDEGERYYPCSDRMFTAIMGRRQSAFLQRKYNDVLNVILKLVDEQIEDPSEKSYLESLIVVKFKHETRDEIMIPSRLEKRLLTIFIKRTQIEDPYIETKTARNRNTYGAISSQALKKAFNTISPEHFADPPKTLAAVTHRVRQIELQRLLSLCVDKSLWACEEAEKYAADHYMTIFKRPLQGDGTNRLFDFLGVPLGPVQEVSVPSKKILWLADESGEIIADMAVIRFLVRLGHKVIVAVKGGSLFTKASIVDAREDQTLSMVLQGAEFISDPSLSKNDLVRTLRSDRDIFVLSDGTRENLNLLLATTTFARLFKEVDGVISRGEDQKRRFFDTHFRFTQEIFNLSAGPDGAPLITRKERHPAVIKFSHRDLEKKAETIIDQMKSAKANGKSVMFYSGIIGSIPGKIDMAKNIMTVFIQHLMDQMADIFIINPSVYYEPGMDADDLMYMWEIVQRSGQIDIWRFQTYDDITTAFQILRRKVPPEWVGKDATYSTGCTKEMHIAVDVQQCYPEMQIIGPSKERFMRRKEYGVGTMHDRRLQNLPGA